MKCTIYCEDLREKEGSKRNILEARVNDPTDYKEWKRVCKEATGCIKYKVCRSIYKLLGVASAWMKEGEARVQQLIAHAELDLLSWCQHKTKASVVTGPDTSQIWDFHIGWAASEILTRASKSSKSTWRPTESIKLSVQTDHKFLTWASIFCRCVTNLKTFIVQAWPFPWNVNVNAHTRAQLVLSWRYFCSFGSCKTHHMLTIKAMQIEKAPNFIWPYLEHFLCIVILKPDLLILVHWPCSALDNQNNHKNNSQDDEDEERHTQTDSDPNRCPICAKETHSSSSPHRHTDTKTNRPMDLQVIWTMSFHSIFPVVFRFWHNMKSMKRQILFSGPIHCRKKNNFPNNYIACLFQYGQKVCTENWEKIAERLQYYLECCPVAAPPLELWRHRDPAWHHRAPGWAMMRDRG